MHSNIITVEKLYRHRFDLVLQYIKELIIKEHVYDGTHLEYHIPEGMTGERYNLEAALTEAGYDVKIESNDDGCTCRGYNVNNDCEWSNRCRARYSLIIDW